MTNSIVCLLFTERKGTPFNVCRDINEDETLKLIERLKVNTRDYFNSYVRLDFLSINRIVRASAVAEESG